MPLPPLEPDSIVGQVYADFRIVSDGAGGRVSEPQTRIPVTLRDLSPAVRDLVLNAQRLQVSA